MGIRAAVAITILILVSGCGRYMTTQELLDSSFVSTRSLVLTVPGDIIYDGKDFDARLEGHANSDSGILKTMSGSITWALTGGGTLTQVNCPAMAQGVQICRMRYSGGLTTGQTKVIKLKATHVESGQSTSEGFTVATQGFSVSVPSRINANTTFTAIITAVDPYGNANASYSGSVVPYLALMPGRPNVEEISNFVNGVATVQMQIHKPAWQMQLVVYDKSNKNYSGTSNTFRVIQNDANYVSLDLVAVPISATSNRLSWTYLDNTVVSAYKIYRKDSTGTYQLLFTETTTTKSYYVDSSLTTGSNYDYKVEAIGLSSNIISTDFSSSTPKPCTVVSTSPTGYTVWQKSQSPYCGSISLSLTAPLIVEPGVVILWNGGGTWSGGGQLLQLAGTPNDRIIISSSSATPAAGHFPGFGVTTLNQAILDASGNYTGGSIWKYVVIEYGGGAYWQASTYVYQSWIYRYNNSGFVFENSNTIIDGGVYVRNSPTSSTKGPQTSVINNMIFFRNSGDTGGAFFVKTDVASSSYNYKITGNYVALNASTASTVLPSGGFTIDPQAPGTTAVGGTYQITDNQFLSNTNQAQGFNGGALRLGLFGTPTYIVSNNTFSGNSSTNGGAISVENVSGVTMTISNNYFTGNSAGTNGGAIRVASGTTAFTVTNNQYFSNTATAGKNLFNGIAQNHNLQFSYWDGATDTTCAAPNRLALGIADSCGGGGSGTVNATNGVSTTYPLCIDSPTATNCVGAR